MSDTFDKADIEKITRVLKAEKITYEKDHFRVKIANRDEKRILVLETLFPKNWARLPLSLKTPTSFPAWSSRKRRPAHSTQHLIAI